MFALSARIQTLLRGHKYAFFLFQGADFGCGQKYYLRLEWFEESPEVAAFCSTDFQKTAIQIIIVISRKFTALLIIFFVDLNERK